jgi:hypothetical protein
MHCIIISPLSAQHQLLISLERTVTGRVFSDLGMQDPAKEYLAQFFALSHEIERRFQPMKKQGLIP